MPAMIMAAPAAKQQKTVRRGVHAQACLTTLPIPPGTPWWLQIGATLVLWVHIAGGSFAIMAGAVGLAVRKGSPLHRMAGHMFFVSMIAMATIGAAVAPFLLTAEGERKWSDSLVGLLALYLVVTGWMTMRRKPKTVGASEYVACASALAIAAAAITFGAMAASRASGTYGGSGPSGYYLFALLFAAGAALDLKVIVQGGASGRNRLARHIWRVGLAMFIATGSFFLGQQRVMPEWMQGSLWLAVPPLLVLGSMLFWLVRIRIRKWVKLPAERRFRMAE